DEINQILIDIRKKHYDAKHNCYAYILGDNQEIQKASDDGEPQKTAGFPMLDVLKKNNLTNILAITTRYFGGILLGSGGLIRAYSSSVSEALKKASFCDMKLQSKFCLTISYNAYNTLLKVFNYITIIDTSFQSDIILTLAMDKDKVDEFKKDLYKYNINGEALTYIEDTKVLVDC
nr:YigZ family protein [Acholeplasmatales bacterium]